MTDVDYSKPMDFDREDITGYKPDRSLIGKCYRHYKTGRTYRIAGFAWDGEVDEWTVMHFDVDDASRAPYENPNMFVRSVPNFFGPADVRRMTQVA